MSLNTRRYLTNEPLVYQNGSLSSLRATPVLIPELMERSLDDPAGSSYEIEPLYDDKHRKMWLAGTASYRLNQGDVTKYILKIPDLSLSMTDRDQKEWNSRIVTELRTLQRTLALKDDNPVTPLVLPAPEEVDDEEKHVWVHVIRHDSAQDGPLEVKCMVRQFVPGCTLREWCEHYVRPERKDISLEDSGSQWLFRGLLDVRDWFKAGWAIAHALRLIHRQRIIHGYLSPDNIVIGPARRSMPAPGESNRQIREAMLQSVPSAENIYFINTEQFSKPGNTTEMYRRLYDAPEKWEPHRDSEWYSPADMFSFGMVLLYLAIGDDIVAAAACRANDWESGTLRVFDTLEAETADKPGWYKIGNYGRYRESHELRKALLTAILNRHSYRKDSYRTNEQTGSFLLDGKLVSGLKRQREMAVRLSTIIMDCIDPEISRRAPTVRGVLRQMRFFSPPLDSPDVLQSVALLKASIMKSFEELAKIWTADQLRFLQEPESKMLKSGIGNLPAQLTQVLLTNLGPFLSDFESLGLFEPPGSAGVKRRSLRITAGRQHLVETMVAVLSCLDENYTCTALLTPTFWYAHNMGEFGRVLRMLELGILAGTRITWILVVNPHRFQQPKERNVLRYQSELSREWARNFPELHPNPLRYAVVDDDWYTQINRDKLTHIRISKPSDPSEELTIAPNYSGEGQRLTTLRFWVGGPPGFRDKAYKHAMDRIDKAARPLQHYNR